MQLSSSCCAVLLYLLYLLGSLPGLIACLRMLADACGCLRMLADACGCLRMLADACGCLRVCKVPRVSACLRASYCLRSCMLACVRTCRACRLVCFRACTLACCLACSFACLLAWLDAWACAWCLGLCFVSLLVYSIFPKGIPGGSSGKIASLTASRSQITRHKTEQDARGQMKSKSLDLLDSLDYSSGESMCACVYLCPSLPLFVSVCNGRPVWKQGPGLRLRPLAMAEAHFRGLGCRWETFYIFAYSGLVGNPHLRLKSKLLFPFQRQPSLFQD